MRRDYLGGRSGTPARALPARSMAGRAPLERKIEVRVLGRQLSTDSISPMIIEPFQDRLLVHPIDEPEVTRGGLYIPSFARQNPYMAIVLAVGDGVQEDIDEGDEIAYEAFSGVEIAFGGDEFLLLRQDQVLAKVEACL